MILVGPSGCGKSTLLRMIAGFNSIEGGDFYFGDQRINDVPAHKRDIGMVFQNYALYPNMSVYDNIAFSLSVRKVDKKEIKKKVYDTAKMLGIEHLLDRRPGELSGGQKQRLSIARAIAKHPQIYLFDDSFSALDYKTDVALRRALKAKTDNATVIIVAQRISTVLHANQILVLDEGRIVGKGTHAQLMESCPAYQEIARSQLSQKELNLQKEGE